MRLKVMLCMVALLASSSVVFGNDLKLTYLGNNGSNVALSYNGSTPNAPPGSMGGSVGGGVYAHNVDAKNPLITGIAVGQDLNTFCIDVLQGVPSGVWYDVVDLKDAPNPTGDGYLFMGATKADALKEMWGQATATLGIGAPDLLTGNLATAFSMAVWEVVWEDWTGPGAPFTLNVATGNLKAANAAANAAAATFLSYITDNIDAVDADLMALTSNDRQDFALFDGGRLTEVPSPASLVSLIGLGLMGLVLRSRRSK